MRIDDRVKRGGGVPSRGATDGARDAVLRDGVADTADPVRENGNEALVDSGGVGGRIDHPKRAANIDVSEGSTRRGMALDADSSTSEVGSSSGTDEVGSDTEQTIETDDCT